MHPHEHRLMIANLSGHEGEVAGVRSLEGQAAELALVGRQPCFAQPPDRRRAHLGEILWEVDVVGEVRISHDPKAKGEPSCFGRVTAERAGAIGETEANRCRN